MSHAGYASVGFLSLWNWRAMCVEIQFLFLRGFNYHKVGTNALKWRLTYRLCQPRLRCSERFSGSVGSWRNKRSNDPKFSTIIVGTPHICCSMKVCPHILRTSSSVRGHTLRCGIWLLNTAIFHICRCTFGTNAREKNDKATIVVYCSLAIVAWIYCSWICFSDPYISGL